VRTGLEKLEGARKVDVSLEKGSARIELQPGNKVTLEQIQTIVKKNGFSPRSAHLKLSGTTQDKQVTISKSGESVLATYQTDKPAEQKEYLIEGNLTIPDKGPTHLTVSKIQ
jgi:copper chaperone CopZ